MKGGKICSIHMHNPSPFYIEAIKTINLHNKWTTESLVKFTFHVWFIELREWQKHVLLGDMLEKKILKFATHIRHL
jgi:hypothetical protein